MTIKSLKESLNVSSLLSAEDANPKTKKSGKLGIRTAVLHLAPANLSGYEVCPKRSKGCTVACLHTAGNPMYMENKNTARIKRTKALFEQRQKFMNLLLVELTNFQKRAERDQYEMAARLNATSDIRWESLRFDVFDWVAEKVGQRQARKKVTILELFPDVQFYDYTKLTNRKNVPDNYYLTFSMNEVNQSHALKTPLNVAVVFSGNLPDEYLGREVIDGDEHDYRPQDPKNCVVGLKAKGEAKVDTSGFTVLI